MKSFVPLESNPEVFNEFLAQLGVTGVEFTDVYGLDPDLLAFIPRPVRAVLLVFPVSETYEAYRKDEDSKSLPESHANWSPQTIRNACGTMGLIHALANGVPSSRLGHGPGRQLIDEFNQLPAGERPKYLENNEELERQHAAVASGGDTSAPEADADIENHYVCLTKHGDELVELDGRRKGPIVREKGIADEDVLAVSQAVDVIREFIDREGHNAQFAMLALVDRD